MKKSTLLIILIWFAISANLDAQSLSGTYTIGGSNPDYATISAAVTDLTTNGISGTTTFNIRTGTYNEQVSLDTIIGASANDTVVFQSEAGAQVIMTYEPTGFEDNYVVKFNGADYVTFKDMTLISTGTTGKSYVFNFQNGSENITLENDSIIGTSNVDIQDGIYHAVIYLDGQNYNIAIRNNTILNGSYGIFSRDVIGLNISNNTINNFYQGGIWISDQFNGLDSIVISSNELYSRTFATVFGIYIDYSGSNCLIVNNMIQMNALNRNSGMLLSNFSGTSGNEILISNNIISTKNATYYSTSLARGCVLSSCSYVKIFYNSINITDGMSTNTYACYFSSCTDIDLKNNNFVLDGCDNGYSIYNSGSTSITSDYNNLYSTGTNLGYWNADVIDLSAWQTASSLDANSLSVDPYFVNDTNLHARSIYLDNAGTPISSVSTDIDGEQRSTTNPDIGADEFTGIDLRLAGNYTIGGTSPDYTTISEAVTYLTSFGISGTVSFNIRTGTYNEQVSIDLIAGVSSNDTIVFQSETGADVTMTYEPTSSDNYIVKFNGCDFISFKGITSEATGTTNGGIFDFRDGSDYITIDSNEIYGINISGNSSTNTIIHAQPPHTNGNIRIINNDIYYGAYAIDFPGDIANNCSNNIISNNIIRDFNYYGIKVHNQDSMTISGNQIIAKKTGGYETQYGIEFKASNGENIISSNEIVLYGSNWNTGMSLDLNNSLSGSENFVVNNTISCQNASNITWGMLVSAKYTNIYYNSINVLDGNASSSAAFYLNQVSNTNIKNNIFAFTSGSNSGFAFYNDNSSNSFISDYNDLYSTGTNLGYWNANVADLSAWQTASGLDANSVSANPLFAADTNLHANSPALDGQATPIASITLDIDGDIRDATNPAKVSLIFQFKTSLRYN